MAFKTLLIDESEFIDFRLYGLVSEYTDPPQFIYHLNQYFGTQFQRSEDLDVIIKKETTYYPVFEWEDCEKQICYHIIKNNAYTLNNPQDFNNFASLFEVTPFLIAQFKEYNYLLRISGDFSEEIPFTENAFIRQVTKLETNKVKTIGRLIF